MASAKSTKSQSPAFGGLTDEDYRRYFQILGFQACIIPALPYLANIYECRRLKYVLVLPNNFIVKNKGTCKLYCDPGLPRTLMDAYGRGWKIIIVIRLYHVNPRNSSQMLKLPNVWPVHDFMAVFEKEKQEVLVYDVNCVKGNRRKPSLEKAAKAFMKGFFGVPDLPAQATDFAIKFQELNVLTNICDSCALYVVYEIERMTKGIDFDPNLTQFTKEYCEHILEKVGKNERIELD